MVPNISPNGRSFAGAGAYHLHDKPSLTNPRPRTAERVGFVVTRNLANGDPHLALAEMTRTAEDALYLKTASGAAAHGRKNRTPVKTMSLAWAPGETPSQEEMTKAADSFLRALGWHEHQAIYAAHTDTAHPHVHIILNRVHPDTGRTLNDWQERERAQRWALSYERGQGRVLCPARAAKLEHGAPKPHSALPYQEAKRLGRDGMGARATVVREVRDAFREAWARHYRHERAIRAELDAERQSVLRHAAALAREGNGEQTLALLDASDETRNRALRDLARERAVLGAAQYAELRARLRETALQEMPRLPTVHRAAATGTPSLARTPAAPLVAKASPPGPARVTTLWKESEQGRGGRRIATVPSAANDNSAACAVPARRQDWASGVRLRGLGRDAPATRAPPRTLPAGTLRAEGQQLWAMHAAARALLRRRHATADKARALAESDIALAFASRWAAVRRLPQAVRAAAIAALIAEQAAALTVRARYHAGHLHAARRTEHAVLSVQQKTERTLLAQRHKPAWAAAAAGVHGLRAPRAPPGRGTAFAVFRPGASKISDLPEAAPR